MNTAIGLVGYALLIIFAASFDLRFGLGTAAAVCLYLAYANQLPRKGAA